MFSRLAIVNRGEAAMRLVHAVREYNAEHGTDVRTIALYTQAERGAMFAREADEAVLIGPGDGDERSGADPARAHDGTQASEGGGPGSQRAAVSPYLDHAELERALLAVGADAVWVGWGFVAEDPAFVELCDRLEVVFIGPGAEVMRRLGDKIEAKRLAEAAGVPVAPWSGGAVVDIEEARRHGKAIGYPLMVKATAGGGGRGIRLVAREEDLADAFERARAEAGRSFGDSTVFMERQLTDVRHVEVQIIADHHGTVWAPGVRDCSAQRRNQKVIEESASTVLSAEQEDWLRQAAVTLARQSGYRNAGTVEFLYQPATAAFAFLEVNPRLQVEHPVTEVTTGLDLVKLQLHVAAGGSLGGEPPDPRGHAIEARLNAEDPDRGFAPAPGTIELLSLPTGPGIRVDTGIGEGDVIPPEFDSMVAKVIAWGNDREEARARLHRALTETTVLVRDGTTNKAFLLNVLDEPVMRQGRVTTAWLDTQVAARRLATEHDTAVALVVAAIEAAGASEAIRRSAFLALAARGRAELDGQAGETVELRHQGRGHRLSVLRTGPVDYRVELDGDVIDVEVDHLSRWSRRITVNGRRHRALVQRQGSELLVDLDGWAHRFALDDGGMVRAPAAGVVVVVHVQPGDLVAAGDRVVVLESMKMEVAITAPSAGRIRQVFATTNVQVGAGTPLVRLDPVEQHEVTNGPGTTAQEPDTPGRRPGVTGGGHSAGESRSGLRLTGPQVATADPVARCAVLLGALRHAIMGFDWSPTDVADAVQEYRLARAALPDGGPDLVPAELGLLDVFADLSVLWRNRRGGEVADDSEEARSASEYLNTYLRSLDPDREGLPAAFVRRLERAVRHYGVRSLSRTPELEEALYRVFHAQRRAPAHLPGILGLVDERRTTVTGLVEQSPAGEWREEIRDTLDRLILATQLRYPVIGDVARSIRYRWFDEPVIRRSAERVLAEMRDHLAHLDTVLAAAGGGTERLDPARDHDLDELVACPQPLLSLLSDRPPLGERAEPMLEVLTRRYYKIRPLTDVRPSVMSGMNVVSAAYARHDRTVRVLATYLSLDQLGGAAELIVALAEQVATQDTAVVDVYIHHGVVGTVDASGPTTLAAAARPLLESLAAVPVVTRVTLTAVGGPPTAPEVGPDGTGRYLTYRREGHGFVEDTVMRGLHPMIARRLQLWRLANFTTTPLPSSGDTYVFRCVSPANPADERFVAVAEVRDLTPVRGPAGQVTSLPELEHILGECLEGLRRAQADLPPNRRPSWNRVVLHVWPTSEVPLDELLPVAGRLVPLTTGLGLEQVLVQGRFAVSAGEAIEERVLRLAYQPGTGLVLRITDPPTTPMQPLDSYTQKVIEARRRGAAYPYELVALLTADAGAGPGSFREHDLGDDGRLVTVDRASGNNTAGIVVGVITTPTSRYPEGMVRVALLGDPTKSLGSITEAECRRVLAALDLAAEMHVPVEWFALSAGARIAMDSGTENLDWVARALRGIVEFTQAGGEVNVIVAGINVGAQPYWNAEATMLMHTRGILVMTPDSAMVLTGKQALEFSGGVSAEDNAGIGGYERIMGPNGEAQYWAPDLAGACAVLLAHYEHAYVAPSERFPRRAATTDPIGRDVREAPHAMDGSDFTLVGDIFSEHTNPGRKKPFDMRTLMRATLDLDDVAVERWEAMREADTVVVLDGCLGGRPVCMVGIESRPLPRFGALPADGPDQWTAGTLFPLSAKKMARAINSASGGRPLVILANLSGFDGSPESLRRLQLEYGAEIARAVVNFDGPIVFCVVSRYHGGAFVVFSATLNDRMEVIAVEGSHASVIGGAPAAAVVFTGEVAARTRNDPRIEAVQARLTRAEEGDDINLRRELAELREAVRLEKLGEVAAEFDAVHTVGRAQQVGSVHRIIPAAELRPGLVDAVERGIASTEHRQPAARMGGGSFSP